jgi:threonine dehydratase
MKCLCKNEDQMKTPDLKDILKAHELLSAILPQTPMIRNEWLSRRYDCDVYLKLEILQPVGSFKIRGATYRISQLTDDEKKKGVIAASAGNHAQGVAWGAREFGTSALIVMPEVAPIMKIQNTKNFGAEVHLEGENYEASFEVAQKITKETGRTYVHAFHDPLVIAGQGTLGLEILEQCPDVDYVVASIGGGGLLAGMGIALKSLKPSVKLVGCQAQNASAMVKSLHAHKVMSSDFKGTFADGIAVGKANPDMFAILNQLVDLSFESDEDEIAMNVLRFMERTKMVVEGSGAITLGALDRYKDEMRGKKVVLVVCGGNIDVNLISRIIERGLTRLGRRIHLKVQISDRPGSLSKLTSMIGSLQANILQAIHDRNDTNMRLDETEVELLLETRGKDHSAEVIRSLKEHCIRVVNLNETPD